MKIPPFNNFNATLIDVSLLLAYEIITPTKDNPSNIVYKHNFFRLQTQHEYNLECMKILKWVKVFLMKVKVQIGFYSRHENICLTEMIV